MGTFSRLRYVIAANVNALLEKAEDPEKLLRALIREMQDAGDEARAASAELLAEQAHLKRRDGELDTEIAGWQRRAERAVAEGRDDLARAALAARVEAEAKRDALRAERAGLDQRLATLEADTATLKQKLGDAKSRLKSLSCRPVGHPAATHPVSPAERRVRRAFGRFDRLQAQVENLEARVQSYETGGPAPRVWTGETDQDPAVEEALEQLKQRVGAASQATGPATGPASGEAR